MIKLWMLLTIGQNISLVNFEKFRKWSLGHILIFIYFNDNN